MLILIGYYAPMKNDYLSLFGSPSLREEGPTEEEVLVDAILSKNKKPYTKFEEDITDDDDIFYRLLNGSDSLETKLRDLQASIAKDLKRLAELEERKTVFSAESTQSKTENSKANKTPLLHKPRTTKANLFGYGESYYTATLKKIAAVNKKLKRKQQYETELKTLFNNSLPLSYQTLPRF